MHVHAVTSRFRNQSGQAAIEFALVVPLLLAVLFLLVGFSRVFNTYNDLNQMAADGARFAAVGNFPGAPALLSNADTPQSQAATIVGPSYALPGSSTFGAACTVGGTVKVTSTASVTLIPFVPYINRLIPGLANLTGSAQMRVEQCPSS
jgi:Flp pilus assembly protein TadG